MGSFSKILNLITKSLSREIPELDIALSSNATEEQPDENSGIALTNVSVTYSNGHMALHDITFSVPMSSILAIVGVNGSGKSTLFKAIMGLVSISSGTISIFKSPIAQVLRKNLIAYVPQTEEIDWNFPILVEELVMMGRYGHMNFLRLPKKKDREIVAHSLERVGLSEFASRQIGELSGGEKKRAFLARALAQNSKVILLDEPFSTVDVTTEATIINILKKLKKEGCIILVSTHNLGSVPDFCDLAVLLKGDMIGFGPVGEVFTREKLLQTFGGLLRQFDVVNSKRDDKDKETIEILTDDERPLVIYGKSIFK